MMSKSEAGKKIGDDSGNGRLLNEIEAISKALYIDKNPSRGLILNTGSSAKHVFEEPRKEKKSIWNWKPLKALSHIRNRRFNCCFSLQVHSVEALPLDFEGSSLCVHWKRRDGDLVTRPVKIHQGSAEFEEKLTITCSVYGSRNGPHHSAKYEAKHFLLYASVYGAAELDLGKHRIDLTKLLPVTLEELEEDRSSGKWTTSFNLSGKAKGAMMNVSFGYEVVGDNNTGGRGSKYNVPPDLSKLRQNNLSLARPGTKYGLRDGRGAMRRSDSLPGISKQQVHVVSRSVEDIKDLHEVLPVSRSELATSVDVLYKKLEEESSEKQIDLQSDFGGFSEHVDPEKPRSHGREIEDNNGCEENDYSVTEQGVELSSIEPLKPEEVGTADECPVASLDVEVDTVVLLDIEENTTVCSQEENYSSNKDEYVLPDLSPEDDDACTKESLMKELELALNSVSDLEATLESADENDNYEKAELDHGISMTGKSHSLDDLTESVANDFLDMLGIEHSPSGVSSGSETDSPRERLLRQFEKEALSGGFPLFGFDIETEDQAGFSYSDIAEFEREKSTEDLDFSSIIQAAEEEHLIASQAEKGKAKAKMLEDLETEALMREWGLNERAFQHSPPKSSAGFGSPIDLPPEQPLELPPLGDGLGPFLQTKDGGFLRSMNPSLFTTAKNGGNLVMQVSSPVVVPAEMGSGIMDILQHLASVGIEKLSMQANKLMPLEDITGKTMQQLAWEAMPSLEGPQSECLLQHESLVELDNFSGQMNVTERPSGLRSSKPTTSSSVGNEMGSEYVSLEDLAPLAMDKIEALSIEGLRIQSGMSDSDAPSNISAQSIGEISALQGKAVNLSGSLGLEGAGSLQLLDIKDCSDDVDGLMGLSLTLDEWMRLDSGEIDDDEDQISERTSKILAAHHAHSLDFIRGGTKGERRRGKGKKCGLLGNNFTVALMVQLRDPLRNYEPVGAPMLSLIQVERVFIPPKPKIYSKVSELRQKSIDEDEDESESGVKEDKKEVKEEKALEDQGTPQYRITEVHVAGLKTEPGKKLWGTAKQQQSGSRWLVANGMGKSKKNPLLKSKAPPKPSVTPSTTKVQPGETLWSISSRVHGTGAKWKELAVLNPHIRNPNVIFPNETIRLR